MVDATRWAHLSPRNRSKLLVSGVNGSHILTKTWGHLWLHREVGGVIFLKLMQWTFRNIVQM